MRYSSPRLIAVSINSSQGNYVQAEMIVKRLEENAKKFDCPIYTFAEDIATGPGYFILASGNRVFADNFSLVGGISANLKSLDLVKVAADNGVKPTYFKTAKHKIRVSPFLDLNEEDKAWVQGLLEYRIDVVKKYIMGKRAHRVPRDVEKEKAVLSGEVFMGDQTIQLGLVDSLNCFRKIFDKEYDDCKIMNFKNVQNTHKGKQQASLFTEGPDLQASLIDLIDEMPANLASNRLGMTYYPS